MNNLPYLIIWKCINAAAQGFDDVLVVLSFGYLLLERLLQEGGVEPIWKGELGFPDDNVECHILDESSFKGEKVLELHLLQLLRQSQLVDCWKRFPDLYPHILGDEWVEAQVEE